MRVFVTRATNEHLKTAHLLRQKGFEAVACPVLSICWAQDTPIFPSDTQALLITSKNALRALVRHPTFDPASFTPPLIAVGAETAAFARRAGFPCVHNGGGTVADMLRFVAKTCCPFKGPLVYGRGLMVREDIAFVLGEKGLRVAEKILYSFSPLGSLPSQVKDQLKAGELGAGIFLSHNVASHFKVLAEREGLMDTLSGVYLCGLSAQVLAPLTGWGRAHLVPPLPTLEGLLETLKMYSLSSKVLS